MSKDERKIVLRNFTKSVTKIVAKLITQRAKELKEKNT